MILVEFTTCAVHSGQRQ